MESTVDWKIHKKLDEARAVYLTVSRGSTKPYRQLELCNELIASGKKIIFLKGETK